MPIAAEHLLVRRSPVRDVRVGEVAVADPYDTSLDISGLSADPAAPGSPVSCIFTVSHHRPFTGVELHAATETWTGAVADAGTGLVVLLFNSVTTKLWNGQFVGVRLTTTGLLSQAQAGHGLNVYVGPWKQFSGVQLGEAVSTADGILVTSVTAGGVPNPSLPTKPAGTGTTVIAGGFWASPWGVGTMVAGGVAGLALVVYVGSRLAHHGARSLHNYERFRADQASAVASLAAQGITP